MSFFKHSYKENEDMAYYTPGSEPEKIKKRLETLFKKLDLAYPDKNIVGLYTDHKKWGETVTELYKELGYSDGKSFLEAYGYTYGRKPAAGGRPKSTDPKAIIEALQKKYPNGSPFKSADALFEANPEYLPKLKTLKNESNKVFGMPLGKYLISIGLIEQKVKKEPQQTKKSKPLYKIKLAGLSAVIYGMTGSKTIQIGDYVEFPIGPYDNLVYGKVEEIVECSEDDVKSGLTENVRISRKINGKTHKDNILFSLLHADAALSFDKTIESNPSKAYREENMTFISISEDIPWACIRGLSIEVLNILDYLIEKDYQIYQYSDLIMMENGISELHVFMDDVMDVLKKYPNVKMAMFGENTKSNTVTLYYSRSGYAQITDSYQIGNCDLKDSSKWTLKHSPAEDFKAGNLHHKFKYKDDWTKMNYVYTDKVDGKKQLGR